MSDNKPEQDVTPETSEETTNSVEETEEKSNDSEYVEKLRLMEEERDQAQTERDNLKVALKQSREKKAVVQEESESISSESIDEEKLQTMIAAAASAQVDTLRTDIAVASFDKVLDDLSDNTKEKELIKMHYQNSVKPTGIDEKSIRNDLQLAKAAANLNHLRYDHQPDYNATAATGMSVSGGKPANANADPIADRTDAEKRFLSNLGVDPNKE